MHNASWQMLRFLHKAALRGGLPAACGRALDPRAAPAPLCRHGPSGEKSLAPVVAAPYRPETDETRAP